MLLLKSGRTPRQAIKSAIMMLKDHYQIDSEYLERATRDEMLNNINDLQEIFENIEYVEMKQ